MFREYKHIKEYEKQIRKLKEQGATNREIGEKLGFTKEQVKGFIKRHNQEQQKLAAGLGLKKKGRPAKDSVVTEADKLSDLRYKLARKDARNKQLEMENELMRDFLSLTRKK